jgi:hypothetical protein
MLRRFLIALGLCLLPSVAFGQTVVTGHVKFPDTTAPSNVRICFTLLNYSPNMPRVIGTGAIVAQKNYCIVPAADGSYSINLYGNNLITPISTNWRVDLTFNNIQQSSATYLINHSPFNLDNETPLSATTPAGPNQVVTQAFPFTQLVPATTWTIPHNFNDPYTTVYVTDTSGNQIFPSTTNCRTNPNSCTLTFAAPTAGFATAMHAGGINIATSQPNVVLQNPISSQTIGGPGLTVSAPTTLNGATLNGTNTASVTGNIALKNVVGDLTTYVSTAGNDANDGLSPGTAKLTIPAALTALFGGGRTHGTVTVAGGNYSQGCTLTVGSTSGATNAVLMLMPGVTITFSTGCTSTTDAIQLSGGSSILCPRGGSFGATSAGAVIQGLGVGVTTVRTMVAADAQNGTVESITVDGCQIKNVTVARAVIDTSSTFNNTRISNNVIYSYTGVTSAAPGILHSSGTGATGATGAVLFDNNWIVPAGSTTAGIILNGVDPQGLGVAPIFGVTLFHNIIESLNNPTVPLMTITGNAVNVVVGLRAIDNWFNVIGAGVANNFKVVDIVTCQECTFDSNFYEFPNVTATGLAEIYLEATVPGHILDFELRNPSLAATNPANVNAVVDASVSPTVTMPAFSAYKQIQTASGNRGYQIGALSVTATGIGLTGSTSGTKTYTVPATVTPYTETDTGAAPSVNGAVKTYTTGGVASFSASPGTVTIGSGTATMTTAAITTLNCGTTVTISATGVATTDVVSWSLNNVPASNGVTLWAWPTANNVNFAYCNPTAGSVTPAAQTVNWKVVR